MNARIPNVSIQDMRLEIDELSIAIENFRVNGKIPETAPVLSLVAHRYKLEMAIQFYDLVQNRQVSVNELWEFFNDTTDDLLSVLGKMQEFIR